MPLPFFRLTAAAMAALACAAPAIADEVWITDRGGMQWEVSLPDMAVFNLFDEGVPPAELRFFLPGLPDDIHGGRGTYFGYWTAQSGQAPCTAALVDPMGTTTQDWGILVLSFDRPDFPSSWIAELGQCFDAPSEPMRGVTPNK